MSLKEKLAELKPKESGLPCGMSTVLNKLSDEDRQELETVLFSEPRTVSNRAIQQLLIEEGYDIAYSSVTLHRRQQCRCFTGRSSRRTSGA